MFKIIKLCVWLWLFFVDMQRVDKASGIPLNPATRRKRKVYTVIRYISCVAVYMIRLPLESKDIEKVFRWKDTRSLLLLLTRTPYKTFTITEIIDVLGIKSRDSFIKLVDSLEDSKIIKTTRIGKKRLISINRDVVTKPEDATLLIPQDEYRIIVKEYMTELKKKIKNIHAIILFGSVANGTADRASDIDIFIAVDNPLRAEQAAAEIAKRYLQKAPGRERYSVKLLAESLATLSKIIESKPKEMAKIIREGIILYHNEKFEKFMEKVKI